MQIPAKHERTVEVGGFAARLAFVNPTRWSPSPRHPAAASRIPIRGSQEPQASRLGFSVLESAPVAHLGRLPVPGAPFGLFSFTCFAGYDGSWHGQNHEAAFQSSW